MTAEQHYGRFRKSFKQHHALELLLELYTIKYKCGIITLERLNRIYDVIAPKINLKPRIATIRASFEEYEVKSVKSNVYELSNGEKYNYNELYFK